MSIIDSLNTEQRAPVLQTEGAVLVTAGAGSGKTRLLTHRIAYLITEIGVEPSNILAITFTNKAAKEMKNRVINLINHGGEVWISTFHSLCVTILRRFVDRLGFNRNFSIYSDVEKNRVLKDIYKELRIDDEGQKKNIEYHIGSIKNSNAQAEEYCKDLDNIMDGQQVLKAYNLYQDALKNNNALDFDDLLVKTYELLKFNKEVRDYYQDLFHYIHVDEFQDTNSVQYDIVSILAGKWGNILVVGDEDQCIYGWRGANIQNILDFKKDFPNTKVYKLEQNYRSTKKILDLANKVIEKNTQRLKKTLWTENKEGTEIVYYVASNDKEEADFVARTIKNSINSGEYDYRDFAILIRLNAPSRVFEDYMMSYNLPYKMLGGFKFYERTEIKTIVAYLRALINPLDNESILRIINYPKRGIGDTTIDQLKTLAKNESVLNVILNLENYSLSPTVTKKIATFRELYLDLRENITSMKMSEFAEYLVEKSGLIDSFNVDNEEEYNKLQNVKEFVTSVNEYEGNNPEDDLSNFLESITLISDIDSVNDSDSFVLLSTVHAVKGLEFKNVFVCALEEGIFPIVRGGSRPSDSEEERRLAYVAITRACENLYLTRSRRRFMYNEVKHQEPSRFLKEMGFEEDYVREIDFGERFSPSKDKDSTKSIQNLLLNRVAQQVKDFSSYTEGTKVLHPKFGAGVIIDTSGLKANKMVKIDFGAMGCKTLSLEYAPLQILK